MQLVRPRNESRSLSLMQALRVNSGTSYRPARNKGTTISSIANIVRWPLTRLSAKKADGLFRISGGRASADAPKAVFIGPSILPDRVLPGDCEVRGIVPHLDETQINQLCQMLLVDHQLSFGGDVL